MQCIRPIKAGFTRTGDLTYNNRLVDQSIEGVAFPCRKCLACRLNIAREKAIRAYHESKMHENNIFLTLTYDEENLTSPWLQYDHWQKFIKDLRDRVGYAPEKRISTMVTGEYGELNKRPHWHALLFNYSPSDSKLKYTNDLGDRVYTSEKLSTLWNRGNLEFGSVTLESASYVARYAAKKLVHGNDQDHDFHPIHKTSSRNAIGRSWIEKNYKHTFENGFVVLPDGTPSKIPRYYVDWAKNHKPEFWLHYVTEVLPKLQTDAELRDRKEALDYISELANRGWNDPRPLTRAKVKETILKQKFKRLQETLKL